MQSDGISLAPSFLWQTQSAASVSGESRQ